MRRIKEGRKALMKDEQAVSAVIGVILMIAITVVIAAVVAAFAYGIIGGVTKAPSSSIVIEGAQRGAESVTILHYGGDIITDAFDTTTDKWKNIEVRKDGALIGYGNISSDVDNDDFAPGEEIKITVDTLVSGNTITVVYVPSGDILQRVKVA